MFGFCFSRDTLALQNINSFKYIYINKINLYVQDESRETVALIMFLEGYKRIHKVLKYIQAALQGYEIL